MADTNGRATLNGNSLDGKDTQNGPGKTPPPRLNIELGVAPLTPGLFPFSGNAPGTPKGANTLLNRPLVSVRQLTEMRRRDGQAKALFQLVTLPLRLALATGEWVDPENERSGGQTPEAKFANDMWSLPANAGGMTTGKSKLIRQLLLALADGFSAFEIVRRVPDQGVLKGKITLRKLAYRDPNTIQFQVDKSGGYKGFRQIAKLADANPIDVFIPANKSLVYTQGDEQNPYYGVSMFESAYPHWDAKRKLYYIAHIAAQFAAVPGRIGKIPDVTEADPAQIEQFRAALANFAFNTAMLVPVGYDVVPFNGNSNYDFLKLIDHHNMQMSKSILASFFDSEQRTVLIENNANTSVDADFFLLSMSSIANDIAETLSVHLMPQFIDYNFDSGRYPVFRPGELNDTTKDVIADMFKTVVIASILNSTPEFVRALEQKMSGNLNLDIDYDKIAEHEKKTAEDQQAQAAAEAQAQAQQAQQGPPQGSGGPPRGQQPPGQQGPPQVPKGPQTAQQVAAAAHEVDDLVRAAQDLLLAGASVDPLTEPSPVDDDG
jgi:hypothetical protein